MVVHTPTTGKAEPAARSLTLYTTIPILFLTGDQVDTVLKVLQFWRTHCRELYARHKAAIQRLNGLITLYDGRMCDTSLSNKAFPNHVCVSYPGGPSKEVKPPQLSNQPLHDMGLRALAPLCAAYDHQAHNSPVPVITIQRVKDVCFALLRLSHLAPHVDSAMQRDDLTPKQSQAIAEETLQLFTQPISGQESEYVRAVARLCEEVDDKLTRGLHIQPRPHQRTPLDLPRTDTRQAVPVPSAHVCATSPRDKHSGPHSGHDRRDCQILSPARNNGYVSPQQHKRGSENGQDHSSAMHRRSRSRGHSRSRSQSPHRDGVSGSRQEAHGRLQGGKSPHRANARNPIFLPPPTPGPPPLIHIPDIAPGGRSGGSRVLGKRTYKNHEEAWSPESSDQEDSPRRDIRPQVPGRSATVENCSHFASSSPTRNGFRPQPPLSDRALAVGHCESDYVRYILRAGVHGADSDRIKRDLPIPREVLNSVKQQTWLLRRHGLFDFRPDGRITIQPRSMAEYRRHLIEPGTKDYTFLRMETRAYEFLLCWYLTKRGPQRLVDLKARCPIPQSVMVAADGAVNFYQDRPMLYELWQEGHNNRAGRLAIRPGWRAQLSLPELPS